MGFEVDGMFNARDVGSTSASVWARFFCSRHSFIQQRSLLGVLMAYAGTVEARYGMLLTACLTLGMRNDQYDVSSLRIIQLHEGGSELCHYDSADVRGLGIIVGVC